MKKIVFAGIILVAVGIAGSVSSLNVLGGGISFNTVNVHQKEVIKGNSIKKLIIKTDSTDVLLVPADKDDITAEFKGKVSKNIKDTFHLSAKKSGSKAEITMEREDKVKLSQRVMNISKSRLTIEVPEKMYDKIAIESASGDIELKELKAKEASVEASSGDVSADAIMAESQFSIKVASGDISAKDLSAELLEFSSASGDMELFNLSGEIKADSASGDVTVDQEEINSDITVDSASGDVQLETGKKPESLAVDFKANSGDVSIKLTGLLFEEKSENEMVGKLGEGKYKVKVRTSSGDIQFGS